MNPSLPARDELVRWNGAAWRVGRLDANHIELQEVETGEVTELTTGEWLGGVRDRVIVRRVKPSALSRERPRKDSFMRWKDRTWKVTVVVKGVIHLQDASTGEGQSVPLAAWRMACFRGDVEMLADPAAGVPDRTRPLLSVPITSMPGSMRAAAERLAPFVEAWRDPRAFYERHLPDVPEEERILPRALSAARLNPFFQVVARTLGVPQPGFSTFCRKLRLMDEAGGDLRGALPRHDLQGPGQRYLNPVVESWLNEEIDQVWLQDRRNKKAKVTDALRERVETWNEENPTRLFDVPSHGYVARYIREEVDQLVAARRRGSRQEADRGFRQVAQGVVTSEPLERVEADHSLVRIRVKDDTTGVVLGYPWLTVAIDHYTRIPLSLHVNFENQSLGANLQALRMTMMPKDFLRQLVPDLDYEYPWGVPVKFFFDLGSDYVHETQRTIAQSLGVQIDYAPGDTPEMKGVIERFWRTIKEDVVHGLPGAQLPGKRGTSGIDPDQEVYLTYSELVRRFWFWVSMVYVKQYHRGIDDVPLDRWQRATAGKLLRAPRREDDLNVLLTRVVDCTPTVNGVTWNGLTWGGRPLEDIMRHPSFRQGTRVKVRVDDYDVSRAWVVDPFTLRDRPLVPRLMSYMAGLSTHAHDLVMKSQPKKVQGTLTERELIRNRARLIRQEKERAAKARRSGSPVGSAHAKFVGIGQQAPHGDSLGDVLPSPGPDCLAPAAFIEARAPSTAPVAEERPPVAPRPARSTGFEAPTRFRNRT